MGILRAHSLYFLKRHKVFLKKEQNISLKETKYFLKRNNAGEVEHSQCIQPRATTNWLVRYRLHALPTILHLDPHTFVSVFLLVFVSVFVFCAFAHSFNCFIRSSLCYGMGWYILWVLVSPPPLRLFCGQYRLKSQPWQR